jgi:hypothetical protein
MQTFTGLEYLKIDAANAFGLDKKTWQERIEWFDSGNFTIADAEEEYMARKALYAYEDALNDIPTGHVMYLDATFSGAQIIACLTGCLTTARNNNLVNTGKREDGYLNAQAAMNSIDGIDVKISREDMKQPTMKKFYGSRAEPIKVFGEFTKEHAAFEKAMILCFPGAVDYLNDVSECWDSNAYAHTWTLPDGTIAKVKVKKGEFDEATGKTHGISRKIEVDELGCSFTHRAFLNEPTDRGTTLQANIIQSIDGWIVDEMHRRADKQGFELLSIFDAFGASPMWMNNVRSNYIDIMCDLADMDLLGSILSEVTGQELVMKKGIENLSDYIRESDYMLS